MRIADIVDAGRGRVGDGARRLLANAELLLQTSLAAAIAWFIAHDVLGHPRGFFAPVTAIIALGIGPGRRIRRVAEIGVGVAVGIAVGDLLVSIIGSGAVQLGFIVLLAMGVAVMLGGRPLLVAQAAVSAVLVTTLEAPTRADSATRFVDAFVGGIVGVAVLALIPLNPLGRVRRTARGVLGEMANVLDAIADALERRDPIAARQALARARALDSSLETFLEAVQLAEEAGQLRPGARTRRGIRRYTAAVGPLDFVVRDIRVLARATVRAVELEHDVPAALPEAIRDLARAVRGVGDALDRGYQARAPEEDVLVAAVERASRAASGPVDMPIGALVGQIRSTATDLLRAIGLDESTATALVRRVAAASAGENP